eukprot:COSAG02_NODE_13050_length_1452_cov_43.082779_2_plen_66_part_00
MMLPLLLQVAVDGASVAAPIRRVQSTQGPIVTNVVDTIGLGFPNRDCTICACLLALLPTQVQYMY